MHQGAVSTQMQDKANLEDFSSQMEPSEEQAFDWTQIAPSLSNQIQPNIHISKIAVTGVLLPYNADMRLCNPHVNLFH